MAPELTIDQLAAEAAATLATTGVSPRNGQVASQPDRRMLRYYASLGLLDRPVEVRGRTGLYGRRHLLQVVAIKRLQSSLADIQRRLAGADDDDLAALAGAGRAGEPGVTATAVARPAAVRTAEPVGRTAFWRAPPSAPPAPGPRPVGAVDLGLGVTLVLPAAAPLDDHALAALAAAAAPLLAHLIDNGLARQAENGAQP
jgi:DNA-binding transcriptional MerR regulator